MYKLQKLRGFVVVLTWLAPVLLTRAAVPTVETQNFLTATGSKALFNHTGRLAALYGPPMDTNDPPSGTATAEEVEEHIDEFIADFVAEHADAFGVDDVELVPYDAITIRDGKYRVRRFSQVMSVDSETLPVHGSRLVVPAFVMPDGSQRISYVGIRLVLPPVSGFVAETVNESDAINIVSGMAEFDGINTGSSSQNGQLRIGTLKGSVTMTEPMDGLIFAKRVILGASIILNAPQSGDIIIEGDLEGDIFSTSTKNTVGSVNVEGRLGKGARIIYEGLVNGLIDVERETAAGSLIHLAGGLGLWGRVVVNSSRGDFDAIGAIHVGKLVTTFPLSPVVYDGSIRVLRGSPDGGDLLGLIAVTSCHATATPLDICVCGQNLGAIITQQQGCSHHVGVNCQSGC